MSSSRHECPRCKTTFSTASLLLRHSIFIHNESLRDPHHDLLASEPSSSTDPSPPPSPTPPPSPGDGPDGTIYGPFEQKILYPFESDQEPNQSTACVVCEANYFSFHSLKRHHRVAHSSCHVNYHLMCRECGIDTGSDGRSALAHFRSSHL